MSLWSLGQQRCITTLRIHEEGVWCLASNDSFSTIFSGRRDRKVFITDLRSERHALFCEESAPILSLILLPDSLWVSTTDSSLKNWPLNRSTAAHLPAPPAYLNNSIRLNRSGSVVNWDDYDPESLPALCCEPDFVIKGNPGIPSLTRF